jgi:thiamine-phosphate pyrophosphorylase
LETPDSFEGLRGLAERKLITSERMRGPLLCYITDRMQFTGDERMRCLQLLDKIGEVSAQGVDFIQLREKDLTARELEQLAGEAAATVRKYSPHLSDTDSPGTKLLINSRTDIALAVGADGVHLRSEDVSAAEARAMAHSVQARNPKLENRKFIVSVSCHSEVEVRSAAESGADFVVFAPVFEKPGNLATLAVGVEALSRACRYGVPVLALGGVTMENARSCLEVGATGIAGIRLFQQNAIADVVRALRR